jgi:predicted DNA-binding transcriptional regulator AlpA
MALHGGGQILAERFISCRQTSQRTNLSERSISRKVAAQEFPQPIPISEGRKAFIESEVDAWIEKQVALARKRPPPPASAQPDLGKDQGTARASRTKRRSSDRDAASAAY